MEIIEGKDLMNMKFTKTEDGLLKEYKPQKKFIPEPTEKYWFIDNTGDVVYKYNSNGMGDAYIFDHQLVFRTKEECEDYKWFLDKLDEYKDDFSKENWENKFIYEFILRYDHEAEKIDIYKCFTKQLSTAHYFPTKENIKKFTEIVGEERIKKYLFDIWE